MISILIALALAPVPDIVDDRLRQFAKAIKTSSIDRQLDAIEALSRVRDVRAARKLAQVAGISFFSSEVRVAAADAVGRIGDPRVGPVIQASLMPICDRACSGAEGVDRGRDHEGLGRYQSDEKSGVVPDRFDEPQSACPRPLHGGVRVTARGGRDDNAHVFEAGVGKGFTKAFRRVEVVRK